VLQIVALLTKDFVRLIVVALALAAPVAYLAMDRWLDTFAYRIGLSPGVFLVVGAATVVIAWLTVGYQSVRAALTDPVKALRYE